MFQSRKKKEAIEARKKELARKYIQINNKEVDFETFDDLRSILIKRKNSIKILEIDFGVPIHDIGGADCLLLYIEDVFSGLRLEKLMINESSKITDRGIEILYSNVNTSNLTHLSLNANISDFDHMSRFLNFIKQSKITNLNICWCTFPSLNTLFKSIENKSIENLTLDFCKFKETSPNLEKTLLKVKKIDSFSVSIDNMSTKDIDNIIKLMPLKKIKEIDFSRGCLSNYQVLLLAKKTPYPDLNKISFTVKTNSSSIEPSIEEGNLEILKNSIGLSANLQIRYETDY